MLRQKEDSGTSDKARAKRRMECGCYPTIKRGQRNLGQSESKKKNGMRLLRHKEESGTSDKKGARAKRRMECGCYPTIKRGQRSLRTKKERAKGTGKNNPLVDGTKRKGRKRNERKR